MAKMPGPTGPPGFNGSQGVNGSQGPVGPRGPKGAGDFSLCEFKTEESGTTSSGDSADSDIIVIEPRVSISAIRRHWGAFIIYFFHLWSNISSPEI